MSLRIGMDIGGTFTDYVLLSGDEVYLHKRLTTPHNPAEGALAGLHELLDERGLNLSEVSKLIHGTTLVTNAIIERRGCKTALLTTKGFRDILEMGTEQRYDIYDLFLQYPDPLVPRKRRLEVSERISRDGDILQKPNLAVVNQQVKTLVDEGVEALAICFLHSYRNPTHERRVAERIRESFPELAVSVSSEVVPEIREFERTATTVANAYVQPLMERYVKQLECDLKAAGFQGRFYLMQSSGGSATPETARTFPIRFLESGPAGGVLVSAFLGRALGKVDLLSFDMGGTTAKACLITGGKPTTTPVMEAARVHRFKAGSGIPIKSPVVDMIEIGAGGGSVARTDTLGLLKVGPHSAGADPGPACYALGGKEPTVTDACLALGYFDPAYFLGGKMALDKAAAERVLGDLGEGLELSATETAWGVYRIVCENMAGAARVHIIEKGQDPRRFSLMAFGGAGPAHAARVARILGSPEVIVPRVSGVASALGFLVAPVSFDFSRSYPAEIRALDWDTVNGLYAEMEMQAKEVLAEADIAEGETRLERRAEMRFAGQFHDLEVAVPNSTLSEANIAKMVEVFEREYARLYHAVLPGYEPMVINWRLRALGPEPRVALQSEENATQDLQTALKGTRQAYFPERSGFGNVDVYDRYSLPVGSQLEGPVIVEERESTTVVNPGDRLHVDEMGNLRVQIGRV